MTVAVVGLSDRAGQKRQLYSKGEGDETIRREVDNINAYLVPTSNTIVGRALHPISAVGKMTIGSKAVDGGRLLMTMDEVDALGLSTELKRGFIRSFIGSAEFIRGLERRCLWVCRNEYEDARQHDNLALRFEAVREMRSESKKRATRESAAVPFRFGEVRQSGEEAAIVVPSVSSEGREYLPVGYVSRGTIVSNLAYALFDAPLWNMALIASRVHLVWIATVCGKLKTDFRYSNTLGWNTFPLPSLTDKNRADLTASAENILLAREAHFPATVADLYDPDGMPENLRAAHERNDEVLERIYIGRRFRNDTERLEKLFDMYAAAVSKKEALPRKLAATQ